MEVIIANGDVVTMNPTRDVLIGGAVVVDGTTIAAVRVAYAFAGTAVPGTDFFLPATLITIPAGRSSVLVTIRGKSNRFAEPFRTVQMTIRAMPGYNLDRSDAGSISRTVYLWDDTQGPVQGVV